MVSLQGIQPLEDQAGQIDQNHNLSILKKIQVQLRKWGFCSWQNSPIHAEICSPFVFPPTLWAEHLSITNPQTAASDLYDKKKGCPRVAAYQRFLLKGLCQSDQHQWDHSRSVGSSSGLPSIRENKHTEDSSKVPQSLRDRNIPPLRKGWESWGSSAWRRLNWEEYHQCL